MKERPILFSSPMVLAIFGGRKTQTRRVMKPQPRNDIDQIVMEAHQPCPHGVPGDRLWVRETCELKATENGWIVRYLANGVEHLTNCAVDEHTDDSWLEWTKRSSIFMPRWASRITLEITGVSVERLQEMTHMDWRSDFCPSPGEIEKALTTFTGDENMHKMAAEFWDSINAKRGWGWDKNPWVWVIEFKRV